MVDNLDAAGRIEAAVPNSIGDYMFAQNLLPDIFDTYINGTGAIVHDPTTSSAAMSVTANADVAIMQSKQVHKYLPGRAIQPEFTHINMQPQDGVIKRIGYFSSSITPPHSADFDGMYLESSDGALTLNIVNFGVLKQIPHSKWDHGRLSARPLNFENFQISLFDFLFLGGSSLRHYTVEGGNRKLLSKYDHSNKAKGTIIRHPAQPIRAEIISTGGAGSMNMVCANVTSSGAPANDDYGMSAVFDTGNALLSAGASGTEYAMLAVRKKSRSVDFEIRKAAMFASGLATEGLRWRLLINPTLSAAFTGWQSRASSMMEYATSSSITVSDGGFILDAGYVNSRGTSSSQINNAIRIGATLAGDYDEMVLALTPLSATVDVSASLVGAEFL